jgi:hypothetical protein
MTFLEGRKRDVVILPPAIEDDLNPFAINSCPSGSGEVTTNHFQGEDPGFLHKQDRPDGTQHQGPFGRIHDIYVHNEIKHAVCNFYKASERFDCIPLTLLGLYWRVQRPGTDFDTGLVLHHQAWEDGLIEAVNPFERVKGREARFRSQHQKYLTERTRKIQEHDSLLRVQSQ